MKYYSLAHQSPDVDFKTATLRGQAPDKGLYFPEHIPVVAPGFVDALPAHSLAAIATRVLSPFTEGVLPEATLADIAPLVTL